MQDKQQYHCYKCKKTDIPKELMAFAKGKCRNICKACRCIEELERRSRTPKEKLTENSTKYYNNHKQRMANLDEFTEEGLEIAIHKWAIKNRNRSSERKFKQRLNLSLENLKMLCYKAREIFPYITFINKRESTETYANWASIDRIDSKLPYSDDNIIVVPMWLNSAKLDATYEVVFNKFEILDKRKFLEFVYKEHKEDALLKSVYKAYLNDKYKEWQQREKPIKVCWGLRGAPDGYKV